MPWFDRHYSANRAGREGIAALAVGLAALGAAGCAGDRGYYAVECPVTRSVARPKGGWEPVFRARDRIAAGPGYVRVTTVPDKGDGIVTRIFDFRGKAYWEVESVAPEGEPQVRLWPLEELFWRLEEEFLEARRTTRRAFALLPPLVRPVRWKEFSGEGREASPRAGPEAILDVTAHQLRIAAYPGEVWDLWVGEEAPLPAAQGALILVAWGIPPDRAARCVRLAGGFPLCLDAFTWDGKSQLRHEVGAWPVAVAPETAADLVPAAARESLEAREAHLADADVLLRLIDGGADAVPGVSPLGVAVRLGRTLTRQNAMSVAKRFALIEDRAARRYLMDRALRVMPDIALPVVRGVLAADSLAVAEDAAYALSRTMPLEQAMRAVGAVLKRARSLDPRASPEAALERSACYLRAVDLLGELSGNDLGFWPGEDEDRAVWRWLDYLEAQVRKQGGAPRS